MNNVILDFEKLVERKAKQLSRKEITPASNVSIFCTGHDVNIFEIGDLFYHLFK
ncbi:Putative uncharacterized protein [Lactobacillus equicursoris 66c]|uniref:Uncharacterized protein n=1 Tax=Lactobacillus equicursoris 66c TaxID=872326 RepID=K0NVJ5_9LACO|nr:hypothetical protein [Lactobacillus equicursoris]CCK83335.1 Putative uncharacterized protein [Lactobacillus equicursoris 66c]